MIAEENAGECRVPIVAVSDEDEVADGDEESKIERSRGERRKRGIGSVFNLEKVDFTPFLK